jgi:hypothetical protein
MPMVITESSVIKCAHQGTVQFTASQQVLQVDGQSVLLVSDVSTGVVSGCTTQPNPQTGAKPCLKVVGLSAGAATMLTVNTTPVLLETANGTTDGVTTPGPPTNFWSVQSAGQTKLASS